MEKQKKSKQEWQGNQPILLKYLLANIEKGILPTKEELEEIMTSMDKRFYIKICHALLGLIEDVGDSLLIEESYEEQIPQQRFVVQEVEEDDEDDFEDEIVMESPKSQHRKVSPPPPPKKLPTASPDQVIRPGQGIGNILGNS